MRWEAISRAAVEANAPKASLRALSPRARYVAPATLRSSNAMAAITDPGSTSAQVDDLAGRNLNAVAKRAVFRARAPASVRITARGPGAKPVTTLKARDAT